MKTLYYSLLFIGISLAVQAQDDTHVLEHIAPEDATEFPGYWGQSQQGIPLWGYLIGHNAYGDEEFGEKYEIQGEGEVVGVIAYVGGSASSSANAFMRVYDVASGGLPDNLLRTKSFTIGDASTHSMEPVMVTFDSPASVEDEFFVTLDLGDYSHDPHLDTLCLLMGPDGSRPSSDAVFGRNVIRWHSHSTMAWRDFMTQNFTPISTYFAIYPVMAGAGALSSGSDLISAAGVELFPVPVRDHLNIRFESFESTEMFFRVFDINGRMLHSEMRQVSQGENLVPIDMSAYASGSYVIALEAGAFRYGRVFTK